MEISKKFSNNNDNTLVVFIHGLGCSKESFDYAWEYPKSKKYSLLAFDLAGFGDSEKPQNFSYSMEDQAEICRRVLEQYPHKEIHLVAHSMGVAIGLLLADKIKHRLASFICLEGNLVAEDCGIASRKTIGYSLEKFKSDIFGKMVLSNKASEEYSLRVWGSMLEKCDPQAFYKSSKSLVEWSDSNRLLDMFIKLKTKKAYIYGDKNSQMEVLEKLKGIDRISIPNSGHFMMVDNPYEFYKEIFNLI